MFCEKCGKQIADDCKFCEHCGTPVEQTAQPADTAEPVAVEAAVATAAPAAQPKASFLSNKRNVMVLAIAAAVIVLAIVAVVVINALPATLVLDDYITIEYEGLSTQGTAELVFNEELFMMDLGEKTELYGDALYSFYYRIMALNIGLELDKDFELTNGDQINILFANNEEGLKELGLKFVLKNPTVTVAGLQEPVYLDVFAGLEFTYHDCAPYAWAEITGTAVNDFIDDYVYYYLEDEYGLSGGSTFTVYADFNEYRATEYGYIIKEKTKTITVDAADLPQPVELNPFDYVTVTFDGIEGDGYAEREVDYEATDFLYCLNFQFNKDSDLSEGDVVTLSYTYDEDPLRYGYTLNTTTAQQYTVPKLDSYITSFTQLPQAEQDAVLAKVEETAKYCLTKENANNGTMNVKLTGTDYNRGNELSHAQSTGNLKLHSVIAGYKSGWWSDTRYLVFVYTFDITAHPNVEENDGNVTGACAYLYIENPLMNGDGTLDNDLEEKLYCGSYCYMSYDDFAEDYLENMKEQEIYTVG